MTYPSFPSISPTFGLSKKSAPNIKTVQFGDGYIQRLTFGLNQNAKTWNPVWENISEAQSDEIELFLDARAANNGQAFTWAAPNEPSTSTCLTSRPTSISILTRTQTMSILRPRKR